MTMEFRERKTEERAKRIARRIFDMKRSGEPMVFPSMDAVVAPGTGGGWQVPEPSAAAMDHMAAFGFAEETPDMRDSPALRPGADRVPDLVAVPHVGSPPGLADMIAAGVEQALVRMGLKTAPVATNGAPPVNEDR